jgi:hypothetical protein
MGVQNFFKINCFVDAKDAPLVKIPQMCGAWSPMRCGLEFFSSQVGEPSLKYQPYFISLANICRHLADRVNPPVVGISIETILPKFQSCMIWIAAIPIWFK